jgi:hypothetical protein
LHAIGTTVPIDPGDDDGYGKKAVGYLFGNSTTAERIYNALFLILLVVGAAK